MMTIKEFTRLCDCNTQTLRYYQEKQALDFSIDEIKHVKLYRVI